jgi:hypothetical protein
MLLSFPTSCRNLFVKVRMNFKEQATGYLFLGGITKHCNSYSPQGRRIQMFVTETTNVLSHLRMCLCMRRSDSIVYAFGRILFGANVAKPLLSDIACISFDERWARAKEATSQSE